MNSYLIVLLVRYKLYQTGADVKTGSVLNALAHAREISSFRSAHSYQKKKLEKKNFTLKGAGRDLFFLQWTGSWVQVKFGESVFVISVCP